ncbi:DUF7519 family protein [Haloplanus sp.]|uniref:DUF7519 family protein n=1 Tax=Haloplanus sp. TaxID=1961696 RepID=UPI002619860C|nr:hypothetical protein [Haloplanus sp.]
MTVTEPSAFDHRPTPTSGVLGLAAGTFAVGLVAGTTVQRLLLTVAVGGAAAFALGGRLWRRRRTAGGLLGVCGSLAVVAAAGYAATRPERVVHRLELLPGLLGLWVLAAGLLPLRVRRGRLLIDIGAGLVFITVLTGGVVRGASTAALVVAAAATILAWDAAENAVSMGGQVGSCGATDSRRAELVHAGFSGCVAVVAVVATLGVARVGVDGLPFAALVVLLLAAVVTILVAHR